MKKLTNGLISKGDICPYRDVCGDMKHSACNGNGCPFVEEGAVHFNDMSCGGARFYALMEKIDKRNVDGI